MTDFDFVVRAGIPEPRRSSLQAAFNLLDGPLRTRETLVGRLCRVIRERAPDALDAMLVPLCDPATGTPSERLRRTLGSALAGRNLGGLIDPLPRRASDRAMGQLAATFCWDSPLDAFALGLDALMLVDPSRAAAALAPLFDDAASAGCVDLTRRMLRVLDPYTARVVPGQVPALDAMMGSLLVGPRGASARDDGGASWCAWAPARGCAPGWKRRSGSGSTATTPSPRPRSTRGRRTRGACCSRRDRAMASSCRRGWTTTSRTACCGRSMCGGSCSRRRASRCCSGPRSARWSGSRAWRRTCGATGATSCGFSRTRTSRRA